MLLSEEAVVTIHPKTIKYYEELGYEIFRRKDKWGNISVPKGIKIIVKIGDLQRYSTAIVDIKCDYCYREYPIKYAVYLNNLEKTTIKKDCCKECSTLKVKETLNLLYECSSPFQINEVEKKIKQNNLIKFGVERVLQSKIIQDKVKKTVMNKYGVEYSGQIPFVIEKRKNTCIERYNVPNPMQNTYIKLKTQQTNIKRYGFICPLQNTTIRKKAIVTRNKTYYINKTGISSKQQNYLYKLLNGELNYPIERCSLDIAFPEQMIYLEYDGSGHDLSVKFKTVTKEEFKNKEQNRYYFLKNKGWREIRIKSLKDNLPSDIVVLSFIKYAKEYLNSGHSWIELDVDNSLIISSQFKKEYELGELRKVI